MAMTEIDYRLSAPRPIEIEIMDSEGSLIDDALIQIRFVSAGVCFSANGVFFDGLYSFDISQSRVVAERKYNVDIYYSDVNGWVWIGEFKLQVIGGC